MFRGIKKSRFADIWAFGNVAIGLVLGLSGCGGLFQPLPATGGVDNHEAPQPVAAGSVRPRDPASLGNGRAAASALTADVVNGCSTASGALSLSGPSNIISPQGPELLGTYAGRYPIHSFALTGMVTAEDQPIVRVRVDQGKLLGEVAQGGSTLLPSSGPVAGASWIGVRLRARACVKGKLTDVVAQIKGVQQDARLTADHHVYTLGVQDPSDSNKSVAICPRQQTNVVVPVAGFWDSRGDYHASKDVFSFACTEAVAAKCYQRWHYFPWKAESAELYEACIRMARADYFGDGQSHTKTGVMVDAYDSLGLTKPDVSFDGVFEAAWDAEGAICIDHPRVAQSLPGQGNQIESNGIPECGGEQKAYEVARRLGRREPLLFNRSRIPQGQPSAPGASAMGALRPGMIPTSETSKGQSDSTDNVVKVTERGKTVRQPK